jgi:hypothetical protein
MLQLRLKRIEKSHGCLDLVVLVAELDLRVRLGHQRRAEDRVLLTGHLDPRHEVRRVASRRQRALTRQDLVHITAAVSGR